LYGDKKRHDDEVEPIGEIYDVDGKRRGLGTLIYPVRNGWIGFLPMIYAG